MAHHSGKDIDITVYGATGFTGRLVAEYVSQNYPTSSGLRWAMAGRSAEKLAAVRDEIGAPADTPDERRARTVSHVLGAFSKVEEPCVDAVLDAVLDGLGRIQRQGMERAGNWINAYRPQSLASGG